MLPATDIAKSLKARRRGARNWMAPCPAHREKTPSLHISEGRDGVPLFHCFGGCSQRQLIDALRQRGLWHDRPAVMSRAYRALVQKAKPVSTNITDEEQEKIVACQRAWDAGAAIENTSAELYLLCRGIIRPETSWPSSLRYLEGQDALVAAITRPDSDEIVGLHVVFLVADAAGVWKKERRSYGPVRLGAIALSPPDTKMAICESLEDALALMQMGGLSTLAVPGTSFLANHVVPPKTCRTVVLAPDNDDAGRAAIEKATPRLRALGLEVSVLLPPPGSDWCEELPAFEETRAIIKEGEHV